MKQKICMIGIASGLVLGNLGFTHCSIEDVGILRSIPNINILSPSDSLETVKCVTAALKSDQSCYIRLTGAANNPIVNNQDYEFTIGKSITLKKVINLQYLLQVLQFTLHYKLLMSSKNMELIYQLLICIQ